jgi:hypothetical protein
MRLREMYDQLTYEEQREAMIGLAHAGKLNDFPDIRCITNELQMLRYFQLVIDHYESTHEPEPTLFKVGGVPEDKVSNWDAYIKDPHHLIKAYMDDHSPSEKEQQRIEEQLLWESDISESIRKHVAIEMKKPCETLQSRQPVECYYGSDEVHDPDPASQSIIDKAFRDYEGTDHTPWRRQAFRRMYAHLSNKQVAAARRLY